MRIIRTEVNQALRIWIMKKRLPGCVKIRTKSDEADRSTMRRGDWPEENNTRHRREQGNICR
jgi:hypothetical protein